MNGPAGNMMSRGSRLGERRDLVRPTAPGHCGVWGQGLIRLKLNGWVLKGVQECSYEAWLLFQHSSLSLPGTNVDRRVEG